MCYLQCWPFCFLIFQSSSLLFDHRSMSKQKACLTIAASHVKNSHFGGSQFVLMRDTESMEEYLGPFVHTLLTGWRYSTHIFSKADETGPFIFEPPRKKSTMRIKSMPPQLQNWSSQSWKARTMKQLIEEFRSKKEHNFGFSLLLGKQWRASNVMELAQHGLSLAEINKLIIQKGWEGKAKEGILQLFFEHGEWWMDWLMSQIFKSTLIPWPSVLNIAMP